MAETIPMALSLPARYYIDPDYYRAELEWYFGEMWFYAGRADEIPDRGDYVLREVAGESLIVVRGDRGEINAFLQRLPAPGHAAVRAAHRGPPGPRSDVLITPGLMTWMAGSSAPRTWTASRVSARRITRSPGWRWTSGTAWCSSTSGSDPDDSLKAQLGGMDERFRAWGMGELRTARRIVYDVAANWKLIIHNYSECLHCPGVHPALQKLSHYLSGENEPADDGYLGGRMGLREGIATLSLDGRRPRRLPARPGRRRNAGTSTYYAVLPNLLLSLHPDYVMTHALWPRGAGRTEIVCEWLFHPDAMAAADFDPEDVVAFWDLTNRQDWHVCEQMQLGLGSRAYRPGPYSHREDLLPAFDRLILERERAAREE